MYAAVDYLIFDVLILFDIVIPFIYLQVHPTTISKDGPTDKAQALLRSALALCAFVGDLFKEAVIPHEYIICCLSTLMRNMTVIEEVRAVHALLTHCDAYLYCDAMELDTFVDWLDERAKWHIHDNASVIGRKFGQSELEKLVEVSHSPYIVHTSLSLLCSGLTFLYVSGCS